MVVGVVAFLTVAITIQTFGPLMFSQAYKFSRPEAAAMTANFWLLNLVMLVPAGYLSDLLRLRKPLSLLLGAADSRDSGMVVPQLLPCRSRRARWRGLRCCSEDSPRRPLSPGARFTRSISRTCRRPCKRPDGRSSRWSIGSGSWFPDLLMPYVTRIYGWQVWMEVMVVSVVVFMGSLLALRGYGGRHFAPAAAHPARRRTRPAAGRIRGPAEGVGVCLSVCEWQYRS